MVGVALVGMAGVLAQSFKESLVQQLEEGVKADYFVTQAGQGGAGFGFSPKISDELAADPAVGELTTFRFGEARVNGSNPRQVAGVQPDGLGQVLNLGIVAGSIEDFDDDGLLIQDDAAEDLGVTAGDTVTLQFPLGPPREVTVSAVYDTTIGGLGARLVPLSMLEEGLPPEQQLDALGALTLAPGADPAAADTALRAITNKYPEIELQDRAEFSQSQQDQINQTQVLVNLLLLTTVIVGVLGIAITLSLAVFERTRELGLLRAIGQARKSTRRMVRLESIIVALFGTVLGIVLGLLFGVTLTTALPDDFVSRISIPWGQTVLTLIGAVVAGVLAALWPAWRASRLKVLDAIAYE
jgi:putative ABC transport system permease protein